MRTNAEIEAETKKGEAFAKKHPHSMFGDDNVARFKFFKKIIGMYQGGKTLDEIEDFIKDAYEDDVQVYAFDIVDWLRGDIDEGFW